MESTALKQSTKRRTPGQFSSKKGVRVIFLTFAHHSSYAGKVIAERMMARLGRCFLPGQPVHLIQRGNNRQPIFFAPEDYQLYHGWLADAGEANGCNV